VQEKEMRPLPEVESLAEAVQEVIRSNLSDGYNPNWFRRMFENGADELTVCSRLINYPNMGWLTTALNEHRNLLLIEDFVVRHGESWGFDLSTIQHARDTAEFFDRLVHDTRYV
jgi:hypothetical protein